MAAATYSSDVLLQAIQNYQRKKVAKKIRKRKENGWEEVHVEMKTVQQKVIINKTILSLPYCRRRQMIAKMIECSKCEPNRSCFLCKKQEDISHLVAFTWEKFENLKIPEKFNFIKDCPFHGNQENKFYLDLSFIMSLKRKKCVRGLVLSHPLSF